MRRFVECYSKDKGTVAGCSDDDTNVDPDNIIRNIPLVALLAGRPELMDTLLESMEQLQVADIMVAIVSATSRIIERYILDASQDCSDSDGGVSVHPIEYVCRDLKDPQRSSPDPLDTAMVSHFNQVFESRSLSVEQASANFGVS